MSWTSWTCSSAIARPPPGCSRSRSARLSVTNRSRTPKCRCTPRYSGSLLAGMTHLNASVLAAVAGTEVAVEETSCTGPENHGVAYSVQGPARPALIPVAGEVARPHRRTGRGVVARGATRDGSGRHSYSSRQAEFAVSKTSGGL